MCYLPNSTEDERKVTVSLTELVDGQYYWRHYYLHIPNRSGIWKKEVVKCRIATNGLIDFAPPAHPDWAVSLDSVGLGVVEKVNGRLVGNTNACLTAIDDLDAAFSDRGGWS
ncbi:MAG: hypothetical protein WC505_06125 [Patescibacteria group bacterium]